ncbi:hypothetical protein TNCV_2323431 [Trichonephila clavipes]|nr:hypothetical protein TNCV_2323431 [Trichonephila clavipes]
MANRFVFMLRREALRLEERQQASRRGFEAWILTSRKILQRIKRVPKSQKNGHQHDHQVANMVTKVTKKDANLALSPRFRQIPIESPL